MKARPGGSVFFHSDRGSLHHGDCLELIPCLVDGGDRFDLIYVDPPFNVGTQRRARSGKGQRAHGTNAYRDAWGGLDAFLAMLAPRLETMYGAVSDRGSMWLHLDYRTVHNAKVLADRVFGRAAYRGEIVWAPGNGSRQRNGPSITHQSILIYSKNRDMIWNADDSALREPYAATSMSMHFRNVDQSGRRYRERKISGKIYRYYADRGRLIGSIWTDCPAMRANTPLISETTGYPTQKPESLLERILRAATLPTSCVLDPMCGSGTTLVVAERLGRRWAGIDESLLACETTRRRFALVAPQRCAAL